MTSRERIVPLFLVIRFLILSNFQESYHEISLIINFLRKIFTLLSSHVTVNIFDNFHVSILTTNSFLLIIY